MAHFAEIDNNNNVVRVIVADTLEWCEENLGGTWLQTSYNTYGNTHKLGGTPFRKNYAGIGFTYDANKDAFIAPKPYPSWILNEETCIWEAPVTKPNDGKFYDWDEATTSWVELPTE
jgi:hypothetical protein